MPYDNQGRWIEENEWQQMMREQAARRVGAFSRYDTPVPSLYPNQAAPYGSFGATPSVGPYQTSPFMEFRQEEPVTAPFDTSEPAPMYGPGSDPRLGWEFNNEPIALNEALSKPSFTDSLNVLNQQATGNFQGETLAGPTVNQFRPTGSDYTPQQLNTPVDQLQQQNIPSNVVPLDPTGGLAKAPFTGTDSVFTGDEVDVAAKGGVPIGDLIRALPIAPGYGTKTPWGEIIGKTLGGKSSIGATDLPVTWALPVAAAVAMANMGADPDPDYSATGMGDTGLGHPGMSVADLNASLDPVSNPTSYGAYLEDQGWHGPNFGRVKTGPGSKDFDNWFSEQIAKETQVTPAFNTTMFDDIFTDQTVSPIDTTALKQAYVGPGESKSRDEKAAANVETFVNMPVAKATKPAKKTSRTTKAKPAVAKVSKIDEMAAIVAEIAHRNELRDQVRQDLMAARDRGTPSAREIQAAINAMMGNEFGGVGGQAGMEAALGRANIETNRSGGWDSQVG